MTRDRMGHEDAERVAIAGLTFLAERPEHLARFLAASGVGPETLRAAAGEPGFLRAVLEFLMQDDALIMEFAETARVRPTLIAAAHHLLDRGAAS